MIQFGLSLGCEWPIDAQAKRLTIGWILELFSSSGIATLVIGRSRLLAYSQRAHFPAAQRSTTRDSSRAEQRPRWETDWKSHTHVLILIDYQNLRESIPRRFNLHTHNNALGRAEVEPEREKKAE